MRKIKTRGLRPRVLFWWAIPISARTQNITKGDGIGILFKVEVQHHPVLKDINRVDKVVDDLPLVGRIAYILLPEPLKPEQDLFPAQDRSLQFFFQNAGLEVAPAGFQLVQALLGGGCQDALFNGLQIVGISEKAAALFESQKGKVLKKAISKYRPVATISKVEIVSHISVILVGECLPKPCFLIGCTA